MRRKSEEKLIQLFLVAATLILTVFRFLLNENGRTNPDSIRFLRSSKVFPVIDNTTTPLGYPLSIKFFTFYGFDEFWASKVVGILAVLFILIFSYKKRFYFRESVMVCGLFGFVSLFSYTMSEALILPAILVFLYISRKIIIGQIRGLKALINLSLMLIILYNIRYAALFIIGAVFLYGILNLNKKYGKTFVYAGIIGFAFVILYKMFFIDYFNENYVKTFLEIGLHPTSQLLTELFQGLTTSFNPFIHIQNPNGGMLNIFIFGIGLINIIFLIFLLKNRRSESENFFLTIGITGIVCSFFIQYFYSVNPLDYRLLAPFTFPVWLIYFKKVYQIFGRLTYSITFLSLITGLIFILLSKGNYLENRQAMTAFLTEENLLNQPIKYYLEKDIDLDKIQIAELISTVNPEVYITFKPQDTLLKSTLTANKVLKKIKIDKNKYQ